MLHYVSKWLGKKRITLVVCGHCIQLVKEDPIDFRIDYCKIPWPSMMVYFSCKFRTAFFIVFAGLASFPFAAALTNSSPSSPLERSSSENKLLILGLGRVGLQVADLALDKNFAQVFGTVKESSLRKGAEERDLGSNRIVQIPFDPDSVRKNLFGYEDGGHSVGAASHVLFTIPLSREADPIMAAVLEELRAWWESEKSDIDYAMKEFSGSHQSKTLGILSTTGVYGNHEGKVVNENSELLCEENSNAELYRQFEEDWISLSVNQTTSNNRLRIFRCAGIYDSSRSALHTLYKNLESGKLTNPVPKFSSSPPTTGSKTNRVHSIDLARGVLASLFHEDIKVENSAVRIYNLADNLPEFRSIVLSHAQELFASVGIDQNSFKADNKGKESDEQNTSVNTSGKTLLSQSSKTRQRRREKESKLVCNKRMREELLRVDGLLFPTYREGLRAIFEDPNTPWQQ